MRVPFYIKLFIAFVIFAILLLGFTYFAFNNFNNLYTEKKEKDNIENILKYQEDSFKEYVKSFDEKMFLLTLKDFIKIEDKQKQLEVFKKFLFVDETILEFSLVSLDAQEIFKVTNSSGNLKIIDNEKLQNIYSNSYYKNIRTLKEEEIWHDLESETPTIVNFILRQEKHFLVLKVDFTKFFSQMYNRFDKKTLILSNNKTIYSENSDLSIYENFLDKIRNSSFYSNDNFTSKKSYLNENKYFVFIINNKTELNKSYFEEYYKSIIIIGLILSILLSLLFSEPIAKINKKIEDENKDLDLNIKKNSIELNENHNVIDKYIMSIRMTKNNTILDVSSAFCYFLGYSKGELIGHNYKMLIHKDMKKLEYIRLWRFVKKGKSYVGEINGIKKDGESFWIDLFVEPYFSDTNKIIGYTIIAYDTTNKKKIEDLYKDLNSQVEQYNAIFENVNSGIALIDLEGSFKKINNSYTLEIKDNGIGLKNDFMIIPHGIKLSFVNSPKTQKDISEYSFDNPFKLLYVSILNVYKHQWNVAEAILKLRQEGYPIHLDFVGGSHKESLQKLKNVLVKDKQNCLNYVGEIPYEELENVYKKADAFVFASSCENMPIIFERCWMVKFRVVELFLLSILSDIAYRVHSFIAQNSSPTNHLAM
mgnify:CR=1 FL=1